MKTFDQILKTSKIVVCAGSGGVGKTTLSAALAVRAAQLGLRTLVLTVDPAKRLATALGLDLTEHEVKKVEGLKSQGQLEAGVIDSKKTFDAFVVRHSANQELAQRLLKNRLYNQLSTTLSGSQEFTSLERLYEAFESKKYDVIILDTPPTKHAIDFLKAPERLSNLFQDSVTKWFMFAGGEKGGLLSGLVNRGTRTVLKSLELLTGSQFIDELVDFFASIRNLQKVLRDRSKGAQELLLSEQTAFIVVTSFDAAKLTEAHYLQSILKNMGYRLSGVIINRAFPLWLNNENSKNPASTSASPSREFAEFYQAFRRYHSQRYELYEKFEKTVGESVRIVRIPEYNQDVHGIEGLERLAERLAEQRDEKINSSTSNSDGM